MRRAFSKAKANAGHIVWSSREVIPVTFQLNGLPVDGGEFANFRVPGSSMYCLGFKVSFQVPASDQKILYSISLYTEAGVLVLRSTLKLNGITSGAFKFLIPDLLMPAGSAWKARIAVSSPDGLSSYYPQTATFTYFFRYAPGPVSADRIISGDIQSGIVFGKVAYVAASILFVSSFVEDLTGLAGSFSGASYDPFVEEDFLSETAGNVPLLNGGVGWLSAGLVTGYTVQDPFYYSLGLIVGAALDGGNGWASSAAITAYTLQEQFDYSLGLITGAAVSGGNGWSGTAVLNYYGSALDLMDYALGSIVAADMTSGLLWSGIPVLFTRSGPVDMFDYALGAITGGDISAGVGWAGPAVLIAY